MLLDLVRTEDNTDDNRMFLIMNAYENPIFPIILIERLALSAAGVARRTAAAGEDSQCAQLRQQIGEHEGSIRVLQQRLQNVTGHDRVDGMLRQQINGQITALRQQITAAQGQMASLGCSLTPNPGGEQLTWSFAGNTTGFGHAINDGRPFWVGDFDGDGRTDVLFHFRENLNWWRGSVSGNSLHWTLAGTW